MEAPVAITTPKVPVTFWFQGDLTAKDCKDLSVGVIDLKIAGATSLVSVSLPKDGLKVSEARQIEFRHTQRAKTSWNGKETWINLKETRPECLNLKVDQIRNMKLVGGFFEPGRPIGSVMLYSDGRRHQQQSVLRSDRSITLSLPSTLEDGVPHRLIVNSDNLRLSARLAPESEIVNAASDVSTGVTAI